MEHRTETGKGSEKTKLLCPQCGGNMEVETQEGTQLLSCPFCGYSEVYEKELTMDEKIVMAHRLAHARESARLRAYEEYENNRQKRKTDGERQARRRKRISALIVWGVILSVIAFAVLFNVCDPTQKTVDPFEYAEVTFSGIDGEGVAKVNPLPVDGEGNDIRYSFSRERDLSEGQEIILRAEGGSYNLRKKKKTYIVSGLDLFVTDVKQLDDAAQAYLYELSENAIHSGFDGGNNYSLGVYGKKYESYSYRPLHLMLLSDGQQKNCILCVYEMSFEMGEYSDSILVAYEMTGVALRPKSTTPLSFKKGYFGGDHIHIGDSSGWGKRYMGTAYGFGTEEDLNLYVKKGAANNNYTVVQKIPHAD